MKKLFPLISIASDVARPIGVKRGMHVLDFGCGGGIYSLAIADYVGARGTVYSVDKDKKALRRLRDRAKARGIGNIRPLKADGSCDIALATQSIDLVLLIDMLHDHYFTTEQRRDLFEEVNRVLKPSGRLVVFPNHLELDQVRAEVIRPLLDMGYEVLREVPGDLVHDESPSDGTLFLFERKAH